MMKRAALTLLILALPIPCLAKYSGGSGIADDPYQIANVADLLTLAADTSDYDKYFILTADINLAAYTFTIAVIAPDFDNSNGYFDGDDFTGEFDGNGHVISNLTINTGGVENCYLGLFGSVSGGRIRNLQMKNVGITGGDYSECLGGLAGYNDGNISNCSSTGAVTGGSDSDDLGGLVGWNNGSISNCYSTGDVTGGDNAYYIGGLVGDNWNGTISDCFSTGAVTGKSNSDFIGGLAGDNDGGNISNCSSLGAVTGGDAAYYIGGLVGDNWNGAISDCFSTGAVTGGDDSDSLGGLAGDNDGGNISNCYSTGNVTGQTGSEFIGGLVGYNYDNGNIDNCYSTGIVTGESYLGGLVGVTDSGSISNCYFLITSGPINGIGTPLTDEQMKHQTNFVGWDFVGETANGYEDLWRLCNDGLEYPKLSWQYLPGDIVCPDGVDIFDLVILCDDWLLEQITTDQAPPGGDGIVNFADFAILANQWALAPDIDALDAFADEWLRCTLHTDIWPLHNGDGIVNFADFTVLANHWLEGL